LDAIDTVKKFFTVLNTERKTRADQLPERLIAVGEVDAIERRSHSSSDVSCDHVIEKAVVDVPAHLKVKA
jgi:hypothetical protein